MTLDTEDFRRRLGAWRAPAPPTEEAPAAVASIVRDGPSGAELLFIERAERAGDPWSGHVAFPGGKREPGDGSLLQTAIRETEEEVGVRLGSATLVGRLEDVVARTSGYRVAQFVFTFAAPDVTLLTSAEVAATLWVPLERLARREGAGTIPFVRHGETVELSCLRIGARVLWGITYRMVMQMIDAASIAPLPGDRSR